MKSKDQTLLEEAYNQIARGNITKPNEGPLQPDEMNGALQYVAATGIEHKKNGEPVCYVRCQDGKFYMLTKQSLEKPNEFGDRSFKDNYLEFLVEPNKFRKNGIKYCRENGLDWVGATSSRSSHGTSDYSTADPDEWYSSNLSAKVNGPGAEYQDLSRHYHGGKGDEDIYVAGGKAYKEKPNTGKLKPLKKKER